jgi:hypothetical protein
VKGLDFEINLLGDPSQLAQQSQDKASPGQQGNSPSRASATFSV